jgi:hypothetical protein
LIWPALTAASNPLKEICFVDGFDAVCLPAMDSRKISRKAAPTTIQARQGDRFGATGVRGGSDGGRGRAEAERCFLAVALAVDRSII